jgi:hypothetical protein
MNPTIRLIVGFMFYIHCSFPEHLSWHDWLWDSCFTYIVPFRSTWVDTVDRVNSGAPERNNVCKTWTPQSTVSTQVLRKGTMYVKHESHNQPCQLRLHTLFLSGAPELTRLTVGFMFCIHCSFPEHLSWHGWSTQVLRKGTMYVKHEPHNQPCQLRCSGKEQCM